MTRRRAKNFFIKVTPFGLLAPFIYLTYISPVILPTKRKKVKNSGVEFAILKVGGTFGIDGEYYLDSKFKQNIEGFNRVGIPVGIYFFSYAKSKESAIKDAEWVYDQIKEYKIDLYPLFVRYYKNNRRIRIATLKKSPRRYFKYWFKLN